MLVWALGSGLLSAFFKIVVAIHTYCSDKSSAIDLSSTFFDPVSTVSYLDGMLLITQWNVGFGVYYSKLKIVSISWFWPPPWASKDEASIRPQVHKTLNLFRPNFISFLTCPSPVLASLLHGSRSSRFHNNGFPSEKNTASDF